MFKYFQLFKAKNDFFHKSPPVVVVSPKNCSASFSRLGIKDAHIYISSNLIDKYKLPYDLSERLTYPSMSRSRLYKVRMFIRIF